MIRATIIGTLAAVLFAGLAALGVAYALDSTRYAVMTTACATGNTPATCYLQTWGK
jgi:hypothetical protein